jgi:DNA N-6-adenine-methyltransferase (Dam)
LTHLFEVSPADVAVTNDDWYTPRWVFNAAGLMFDMDVCAPIDPTFRTCPAREYLTVLDDGLTAPWTGTVWMNPPYSQCAIWTERFVQHASGLALLPATRQTVWLGLLTRSADAIALVSPEFSRVDGSVVRPGPAVLILAARGPLCVDALARVAQADRYARGAYHVRPAWAQAEGLWAG